MDGWMSEAGFDEKERQKSCPPRSQPFRFPDGPTRLGVPGPWTRQAQPAFRRRDLGSNLQPRPHHTLRRNSPHHDPTSRLITS